MHRLGMEGGSLSLSDRQVTVRTMTAEDGFARLVRREDGSFNAAAFIRPTGEEDAPEGENAPPWAFELGKGTLEGHEILFEDRQPERPVQLRAEEIRAVVEGLTNREEGEASVELGFSLDAGGSIEASGGLDLKPLSADLEVKTERVAVPVFHAYFPHPRLRLASAELSASGDLTWSMEQGEPVISYTGRSGVSGLSLVEKGAEEALISCRNLGIIGLDAGNRPPRFHVETMEVQGMNASIVISEQGKLNLVQAFSDEAPDKVVPEAGGDRPAPRGETGSSETTVRIETVEVRDSRIDFEDHHIEPNVAAELMNLQGTVTGLSSGEGRPASVKLQGSATGNAPLEIVGEVGSFSEGLYVDVGLVLKDAGMVHLNPYAKEYVGYAVEKGNMSLDLEYLIDRDRLDSSNEILLDQLTLGEKVEGAAAVDLPVKFAIALLKDRKGRIHVTIPIEGDLGDPKTDLGGIVRKAVLGFLKKAISAPFSFLGAIFGGGGDDGELQYIGFPYGSSRLTEDAEQKLQTVIQVLQDRPQLQVSVAGYVDPEEDARALSEERVLSGMTPYRRSLEEREGEVPEEALIVRAFRERFCGDDGEEGREPLQPEEIRRLLGIPEAAGVPPEDLRARFRARFCGRDTPWEARLPTERMRRLLMSYVSIGQEDLQRLASERAQAVIGFLSKGEGVGSEQLFLKEASPLSPERMENLRGSRVELELEVR